MQVKQKKKKPQLETPKKKKRREATPSRNIQRPPKPTLQHWK
jgi:hypothetical protein